MSISTLESMQFSGMGKLDRILKRSFDIVVSLIGLISTGWIILIFYFLIVINYKESGFFRQTRIGLDGKRFRIFKLKSMRKIDGYTTTVTVDNDPRITSIGRFIRKTKIDELPQLINVFLGDMSFVGPRPDVEEVINTLSEEQKSIYLSVRPGITGPATIKYRNEEEILSKVRYPEKYSLEVIFKDKYEINKAYISNYSFIEDIKYIINTVTK